MLVSGMRVGHLDSNPELTSFFPLVVWDNSSTCLSKGSSVLKLSELPFQSSNVHLKTSMVGKQSLFSQTTAFDVISDLLYFLYYCLTEFLAILNTIFLNFSNKKNEAQISWEPRPWRKCEWGHAGR